MPLINQKRSEKRKAAELIQESEVLNTSAIPPRKLIALKRRSDIATGEVGDWGGVGGIIGGDKGEYENHKGGGKRGGGGGKEPSPLNLGKLIEKANIAFRRKQEREAKRPVPIPKIDRLWFSIVIQHFPRAVPPLWDTKHRGLAKHLANRIGPENVVEFVKWAVENWAVLIQSAFGWMKRSAPPPTPSLPFLVKFIHTFQDAKEKAKDSPLDVAILVKGLNLAKKGAVCRDSILPPVPTGKPILLKKDLSATVSALPKLPNWRD